MLGYPVVTIAHTIVKIRFIVTILTNRTLDYYVDDQNGQSVNTTLKTDRKGRVVVLIQPDGGIILIEQEASKIGIRLELVCTERYKELKFNIYIGRKNNYISSINPDHILSMHCEWRYGFSEVRERAPLPMIAVKI